MDKLESTSIGTYSKQSANADAQDSSCRGVVDIKDASIGSLRRVYYIHAHAHALTSGIKSADTTCKRDDISSTITKLLQEGKVVVSKLKEANKLAERIVADSNLAQYSAIRIGRNRWLFGKVSELYPPVVKQQVVPKILEQELSGFVELFFSSAWYGVLDTKAYSPFDASLLLQYEIEKRGYDPLKLQHEWEGELVVFWYDDVKFMRMSLWQSQERSLTMK